MKRKRAGDSFFPRVARPSFCYANTPLAFLMPIGPLAADFGLHLGCARTMQARDVGLLLGFGLDLVFFLRTFLLPLEDDSAHHCVFYAHKNFGLLRQHTGFHNLADIGTRHAVRRFGRRQLAALQHHSGFRSAVGIETNHILGCLVQLPVRLVGR